jgi:hypothetical protein
MFGRDEVEISLLGVRTTDKPDGVFHSSFFPTVEWFAEVGLGPQDPIHLTMLDIFFSIVIGD